MECRVFSDAKNQITKHQSMILEVIDGRIEMYRRTPNDNTTISSMCKDRLLELVYLKERINNIFNSCT